MSVVLTESDVEGLYGSQHWSAEEIGDRKLKLTVSHVAKTEMPARDNKPARDRVVLSFEGQKKTLVLNTTNYNLLRTSVSRHPGEWVGAVLGVYTEMTSFGGKPTRGTLVGVPKTGSRNPVLRPARRATDTFRKIVLRPTCCLFGFSRAQSAQTKFYYKKNPLRPTDPKK